MVKNLCINEIYSSISTLNTSLSNALNVNIYIHSQYIRLTLQLFRDFIILISMLDQTYSQEFEVQQIVDEKTIDNETHYLVKWIGYGHEENTWEPLRHMTNAKDKIKIWEKFKQKQLNLIQNFQTLDKLDLGPQRNKNPTPVDSGSIEGITKSSTPYRNFKPIILLNPTDKSDELDIQKGKIVTLFDRPQVKKITKRRKVQKKKKQLEIFEQRMKSRPKVWEKYLQNEDQAIKQANKKIKEVVDQVFGSKGGKIQNQHKKTLSSRGNRKNKQVTQATQRNVCFEDNTNEKIFQKKSEDQLNKISLKKKARPLEIFSDSDQETSHLQKPMKKTFNKVTSINDKFDYSDQSINESTNFITNKEFTKRKAQNEEQIKSCRIQTENSTKPNEKDEKMIDRQPNPSNKKNQTMIEKQASNEGQIKGKDKEAVPFAIRTNTPKPSFIQPQTVRITEKMLKMVSQKHEQKIQTSESSSSSEFEQECQPNKEPKASSSSSSSSFDQQAENAKISGFAQSTISFVLKNIQNKQEEINTPNENKAQRSGLIVKNIQCETQRSQFEKISIQKPQKDFEIKFDEFIKIPDSREVNEEKNSPLLKSQIKVQELKKALSESNDIKQQHKSMVSSNKSSTDNFSKKVKLQWSFPIKLSQDDIIQYQKIQIEAKAQTDIKVLNNNFGTNQSEFIPFTCSFSTIEDYQTRDKGFDQNQQFYFENPSDSANLLQGQSGVNRSQNFGNSDPNHEQRIINYSSLTNHRSTALPSQASGQSFHVFTNQNAFNLNLLRNHSLSTRASFNTHQTDIHSQGRNNQRKTNNDEGRAGENDILNQGIYQSTPQHIFSSSSEIFDRGNLTDVLRKSKQDNSNTSLSLEQILELLQTKSSKLLNEKESKQDGHMNHSNQLFEKKNKFIELIDSHHDNPSIQISNNTAKTSSVDGSQKSQAILLDFKDIGNKDKNKASMSNRYTQIDTVKGRPNIEKEAKKKKQNPDLSDFHRMLILENTLTEELN